MSKEFREAFHKALTSRLSEAKPQDRPNEPLKDPEFRKGVAQDIKTAKQLGKSGEDSTPRKLRSLINRDIAGIKNPAMPDDAKSILQGRVSHYNKALSKTTTPETTSLRTFDPKVDKWPTSKLLPDGRIVTPDLPKNVVLKHALEGGSDTFVPKHAGMPNDHVVSPKAKKVLDVTNAKKLGRENKLGDMQRAQTQAVTAERKAKAKVSAEDAEMKAKGFPARKATTLIVHKSKEKKQTGAYKIPLHQRIVKKSTM